MSQSLSESPPRSIMDPMVSEKPDGDSSESLLKTIMRHKLLMVFSLVVAVAVGFWLHRQKPTTYTASTQLMIRSDNPLVLDVDTGNLIGGVPDSQVLASLVKSDRIIQMAANDPEFGAGDAAVTQRTVNQLRQNIRFNTQKNSGKTDRTIAGLACDGTDPDFCVAAVNATARAIESFFEQERASSVNGLSSLINKAETRLLPQLQDLETKYKDFRATAPLVWSSEGEVVNPHRERQSILRNQEVELELQRSKLLADFRLIDSTWRREKDVVLVIQVINQLGGGLGMPTDGPKLDAQPEQEEPMMTQEAAQAALVRDLEIRDLELEALQVEETLVPLEVQQQRMIAEYGLLHPAVRGLTSQVNATRQKLNQLALQRQRRVDQLREDGARELEKVMKTRTDGGSPGESTAAEETEKTQLKYVLGYGNAIKQRISLIDEQIAEVRRKILEEKKLADTLSQAETDDSMYRRQIESIRGQLIQLEDQMAGLKISEVNNGVVVEPLMSSVTPIITGPNLNQDLLLSSLLGLGIGGLLAFLLESNSRMYRNSDQLAQELKLPVIAHIPLDDEAKSRKRSVATGEMAEMHTNLAVVHRPESAVTEAIRCTRTTVLFDASKNGNKVYQITSPLPGDGKSTIASNLACAIAQSGKRTLLIDLDLRSPRLTRRFGLDRRPGMTNLLNGEQDPRTVAYSTPISNLDVCPSGSLPSNPAEALLVPEMGEVMDWFRDHYDFVIVDTPPLLLVTDPAITTQYTDATILAMRIVRKCKPNSKEAISILRNSGANVLGIAVNKIDDVAVGSYYQIGSDGSYRNVGYGYGKQYRKDRMSATGETEYQVVGRSRSSNPDPSDKDESTAWVEPVTSDS